VVLGDLLDYLADEVPGGEALSEMDLAFVRTAQVEDTRYWIWSFEPDGGEPTFATIALGPDGSVTTGYDTNDYGLTPERFILATTTRCSEQHICPISRRVVLR